MEVSMFTGFPDLGMNDVSFIHHQLQVNSLDDIFGPTLLPTNYGNNFDYSGTNQALISCKRSATQTDLHQTLIEKPLKQIKPNNWSNSSYEINHVLNSQDHETNNSSTMLSFSNNSSNCSNNQTSNLVTPKEEVAISNMTFPSSHEMLASHEASLDKQSCKLEARTRVDKRSSKLASVPQQSMDHILAERRRREKLSQRFIALSAIIPGLKKMDKASVLGDAIKYVKQMQERVKKLEEEAKKKPMESAVFVKRSYVSAEDDDHLSAENMFSDGSLPETEVRFSDKDVLIRIQCEKIKGILEKLISQIEDLHLVVMSSSSLAFGNSALAVTIIAQMDSKFSMTSKDLVRHIHTTLKCSTSTN